jgi:hypothetical protein
VLAGLLAAVPARPAARLIGLSPLHGAAVERAVAGARRRLARAECRRIFSDFADTTGAPLQQRLDAMRLDADVYLSRLVFTDGFAHRACQTGGALALTSPGGRVVHVCGPRFLRTQSRRPADADVVVLHEALHTLGLGENPPDSLTITRHVAARCAAEAD